VLLAACGSEHGASREIFQLASGQNWQLLATPYVVGEVLAKLPALTEAANPDWEQLRSQIELVDDVLTLDRIAVFEPAKDRPILFSALAWADVLLTLDRQDFGALYGREFYGLPILSPGMLIERERTLGRI